MHMSWRLEVSHPLFSHSRWLMRVFGTIIQPFVLSMFYPLKHLFFRRTVTFQFVSDDNSWGKALLFEHLAEKLLSCRSISTPRHHNIQHVTILVNRSPQIVFLVFLLVNRHYHFVEMPLVAHSRLAATNFIRVVGK